MFHSCTLRLLPLTGATSKLILGAVLPGSATGAQGKVATMRRPWIAHRHRSWPPTTAELERRRSGAADRECCVGHWLWDGTDWQRSLSVAYSDSAHSVVFA